MTILGSIWKALKNVYESVKSIRFVLKPIKESVIERQIEPYLSDYEVFQKEYNLSQKRALRPDWEKFDTMVNDLIDEYDYDYNSAVDELKYMLETDEIDLDEGYIEFLREHDTP